MFFVSSERRVQAAAFDALRESADRVLRLPDVRSRLGSRAMELAAINDGAFLPDVRDNHVSIPRKQRGTDNVAVIPTAVLDQGRPLSIDPTMFYPTRRMQRLVSARMEARGHETAEIQRFMLKALSLARFPLHVDHRRSTNADLMQFEANHPESGTRLGTRPFMLTNVPRGEYSAPKHAPVLCHEYVHVPQVESMVDMDENNINTEAAHEIEAYSVEAEIRRGMGDEGLAGSTLSFEVDRARAAHNSPDDPFATPPEVMRKLWVLGVVDIDYSAAVIDWKSR